MPPLKDMGLTKIPPPGGHVSQGLEATKLDLKLQAVYISDKSKFAIINGKIYKENTFDDILKILKIVEGRVFIELHTKERRWLNLN
ncbi:MAG: hypothetical protein N2Z80_02145 [Hydrogenothermaceae bacterium]|nr:hypothetical protein [Hydrogenothermaceae bacterium]